MSLYDNISATNRTAMAVATALEQTMGPDTILTVGLPKIEIPDVGAMPANPRVLILQFTQGLSGSIAIVVTNELGRMLEATAPDEEMLTGLQDSFAAAVAEIKVANDGPVAHSAAFEMPLDDYLASMSNSFEYLAYPLLDGVDRIATLVLQIASADATSIDIAGETPPEGNANFSKHEFAMLPDGDSISLVDARSMALLHDVEMGVTAELGRRRMSIRSLLSLTPGAVIELDRAAGSPVDVLVNGTLIARGEVVVIDEEFGIRISEIVAGVGTR